MDENSKEAAEEFSRMMKEQYATELPRKFGESSSEDTCTRWQ